MESTPDTSPIKPVPRGFGRTLHRARLISRIVWSAAQAKLLRKRRPVFLGLYITNRCNLRCKYCFVNVDDRFEDRTRYGFDGDQVIEVIDAYYKMGCRWIFLLGGEPLMHPEIRRIVNHIVDRGMLLHILTNGTLIPKRIDDIVRADGVCVSIDGMEAATDAMRGEGTFKRALRGVETALAHGMTTRVHAVLTKHSIGDMEPLAEMARDMGVTITISPPNYLGPAEAPALDLSTEEYKDFYRRYRRLKEQGYPIGNSYYSIDKALEWPISYHEFIQEGQTFDNYKPIRCVIGDLHGCVDAEGTTFNCIQMGCMHGLNVHDVGIERAWDELPKRRPQCESCASINTIETAAYLSLRPEVFLDGLRFFFGKRKKAKQQP